MDNIFRAYDIRGVYPTEINEKIVFKLGRLLGKYFKGKIVIARDRRLSSPVLYEQLEKGLASAKKDFIDVGPATTPMLYFLVNHFKLAGGIIITASHNPKEYNGMKVVGKRAEMIPGVKIYELFKDLL